MLTITGYQHVTLAVHIFTVESHVSSMMDKTTKIPERIPDHCLLSIFAQVILQCLYASYASTMQATLCN